MANNDLLQKLLVSNLDFVGNEILPQIDKDYARTGAQVVLSKLKETIVALTDDNQANKDQLDIIWGSFSSDPAVVDSFKSALMEAISKIDDAAIKAGLTVLIGPFTKTLTAVTDANKADGEQIKQIWKDFVESPEFIAFILSNLDWLLAKLIKDTSTRNWIIKILKVFIHN